MGGGRPARCVTLAPLRVLTAPTLLSLPAFLSSLPASGRTSCHQQPAPVAFFARATNRAGLVPYASRCVQGVPHAAAKGRAPPSKSLAPFYSPRTHFFLFSSRTPFVAPHTFRRPAHLPSPHSPSFAAQTSWQSARRTASLCGSSAWPRRLCGAVQPPPPPRSFLRLSSHPANAPTRPRADAPSPSAHPQAHLQRKRPHRLLEPLRDLPSLRKHGRRALCLGTCKRNATCKRARVPPVHNAWSLSLSPPPPPWASPGWHNHGHNSHPPPHPRARCPLVSRRQARVCLDHWHKLPVRAHTHTQPRPRVQPRDCLSRHGAPVAGVPHLHDASRRSVYEAVTWTRQSWETHGGTVCSAVWSPCSRFLLWAIKAEHVLRFISVRQRRSRARTPRCTPRRSARPASPNAPLLPLLCSLTKLSPCWALRPSFRQLRGLLSMAQLSCASPAASCVHECIVSLSPAPASPALCFSHPAFFGQRWRRDCQIGLGLPRRTACRHL